MMVIYMYVEYDFAKTAYAISYKSLHVFAIISKPPWKFLFMMIIADTETLCQQQLFIPRP